MKKLLLLLVAVTLFVSCGQDGQDGDVFIRFDWDWYVDAFEDDNPATPSSISKNVDYLTEPGKYTFTFWCSDFYDEWTWEGTYTLTANEGETASLFADGADGEDKYFLLNMEGLTGASLTLTDIVKEDLHFLKSKPASYNEEYVKTPVGEVIEEVFYSKDAKMVVKKQKFMLKKK